MVHARIQNEYHNLILEFWYNKINFNVKKKKKKKERT